MQLSRFSFIALLSLLFNASIPFWLTLSVPFSITRVLVHTQEELKTEANRHNRSCIKQSRTGQLEAALKFCQQAFNIYQEIGDHQGEANSLNNLGNAYRNLAEYEQAIDFYQQSLAISKEIKDRQGEANSLNNLGNAYRLLAEYEQAIDFYEQSLAISREIGDRQREAVSLNNLGNVYESLAEYKQAIYFYQQSLAIAREISSLWKEAHLLHNLGNAYRRLAEYEQAIYFYQQSLAIFRELGKDEGREDKHSLRYDLMHILYSFAEYEQVIDFYQQSFVIKKKIRYHQREATSFNDLGIMHYSPSEYEQVIDLFEQALARFRKRGVRRKEAAFLNNLGIIYYSLAEYEQAIELFQKSLTIKREIGARQGEADSLHNLGKTYYSLAEYEQAIDFYEQSLAIAREIRYRQGEADSLHNLGKTYYSLAEYEQAIDFYQQSLAMFRIIGDCQGEATSLNNIGEALLDSGNFTEAEPYFYESIDILEEIRTKVGSNDGWKVSIFEEQANAYHGLQKVLVAQNKLEEALEVAERGRANALVELLQTRSSTNPEAIAARDLPSVKEIQQIAQSKNTTLVEYSVINNEQLYIWVVQPSGEISFRQVDLRSMNISLEKLIPDTRESIGVRERSQNSQLAFAPGDLVKLNDDVPNWEPWQVVAVDAINGILTLKHSSFVEGVTIQRPLTDVVTQAETIHSQNPRLQQLHQLLIEPIADLLPTDPEANVVFIPHQELFLVPFPALRDTEGRYLIEKHTILTAPAIQILDSTSKQQKRVSGKDFLVVGNPTMPKVSLIPGDEPVSLSPLPYSEIEAKGVAQILQTKPLTGNQATKKAVVEQMKNAKIIHLATHGLLDDDRGIGSAITLAPAPSILDKDLINLIIDKGLINLIIDKGLLTAAEIVDMQLNAELVVLSACSTGQGRITRDGVIGLARSFIAAGVPSVVVSLWTVPDDSTADLMIEFYQNLQKGLDKAQALRQAMLTTMEEHPNPKNWAAFTLIGEV